jgi:hypothetical protein
LAAPIVVRSKRKQQQRKPVLPASASAALAFDFDAQGADPVRVLVQKPNKHGVSVFLLEVSHRGRLPVAQPQPEQPPSRQPRSAVAKPSLAAANQQQFEPVDDDFAFVPPEVLSLLVCMRS